MLTRKVISCRNWRCLEIYLFNIIIFAEYVNVKLCFRRFPSLCSAKPWHYVSQGSAIKLKICINVARARQRLNLFTLFDGINWGQVKGWVVEVELSITISAVR